MEFMATGQTAAGRRGTQRNQVGDNRITLGTSTQRSRRGESIASDMYHNQPARSGTSKAANSKAATKATAARGRNKLLIEDNDTTFDWGSAPSNAKGGKNSFESSGTATLDDDRSSTARKSTQKRKALTVNVDDDEDVGLNRFFEDVSSAYPSTGIWKLWEEAKTLMLDACSCCNNTGPQSVHDCAVLLSIMHNL